MHRKAHVRRCDQHGGVEDHAGLLVAQRRLGPVRTEPAVALDGQIEGDPQRPSEQHHGLIDQMRPQVEPDPGPRRLAPAVAHHGPVAVETALIGDDPAQMSRRDLGLKRQEVGVPAPVLEHRQQQVFRGRQIDQPRGVGEVERERLVHDHGLARVERLLGLGGVNCVGGGDNDQVNGRIGEGLIQRRDGFGLRPGGGEDVGL